MMENSTRRFIFVVFGLLMPGLGYILVVESVLPKWVALLLLVGGYHGAVIGVVSIVGPFGPIRQRVVNLVLGLTVFIPIFIYPYESIYIVMLGTTLVIFGITLRDVVLDLVESDSS